MKRPRKLRSAEVRGNHRNCQLPRLKPGSPVHPVPDPPNSPNPPAAPKEKRRKPYKLNDQRIAALVRSIKEHADLPIEAHCGRVGLDRHTLNDWRKIAEAEPMGEHARQIAKVDEALFDSWGKLHELAVRHRASEVLFRRHPESYPSERRRLELTGLEGAPLIPAAENSFHVVLELHPNSAPLPDKPFVIEHPDGRREVWQQPNGNGQSP